MNRTDMIVRCARHTVKTALSRDPEVIAQCLGINIIEVPFKSQKGVYKVIERNPYIFIKNDLDEVMRSIVLLHEIGHDRLHRQQAAIFQEFNLFDMERNHMEYEANLFAAQIALPDDEILDYIYRGYDAEQIARAMYSDINLVALKVSELSRRGYSFKTPEHKDDFLKS